jgi:hypothetical protein
VERDAWLRVAAEAARDPSRAARLASWLADDMRAARATADVRVPEGYLYAGAHTWIAQVFDLLPEPLPPALGAAPITSSGNQGVEIRTSFDAFIWGVAGWAVAKPTPEDDGEFETPEMLEIAQLLSCAIEGRDLFSVDYNLDGSTSFGTDGKNQLMLPACCVVGTRLSPRAMGWTVRRNQIITVRFRNMTNVTMTLPIGGQEQIRPLAIDAALAFYVVNMERP